jgi:hypothetical protein
MSRWLGQLAVLALLLLLLLLLLTVKLLQPPSESLTVDHRKGPQH